MRTGISLFGCLTVPPKHPITHLTTSAPTPLPWPHLHFSRAVLLTHTQPLIANILLPSQPFRQPPQYRRIKVLMQNTGVTSGVVQLGGGEFGLEGGGFEDMGGVAFDLNDSRRGGQLYIERR